MHPTATPNPNRVAPLDGDSSSDTEGGVGDETPDVTPGASRRGVGVGEKHVGPPWRKSEASTRLKVQRETMPCAGWAGAPTDGIVGHDAGQQRVIVSTRRRRREAQLLALAPPKRPRRDS